MNLNHILTLNKKKVDFLLVYKINSYKLANEIINQKPNIMKLSQELFDYANNVLVKSDNELANNDNTLNTFVELNAALRNVLNAVEVEPQQECAVVSHASEIRDYLLNQDKPEWVEDADNSDNVLLCDGDGKFAPAEGWYIVAPKSLFTQCLLSDGSPDATEEEVYYGDDDFCMSDKDMLEQIIMNINLTTLNHD